MGTLLKARDLARSEFKANPYPFYARLRAEEPVCRISAVFIRGWLVTRYDDAVMVLKDPRISKDISSKMGHVLRFAGPMADHMLNRDPPDHTRLRTLVSKAFTPRRIEHLRGRIQSICDGLLADARPGDFDLVRDYAQRARFVEEPARTESAIEELLRYTSPVEMSPPRLAREDVTIGPVTIRRGELVSAVLGSANRDESQFRDPDTLDIGRDPNRHLALGLGAHFCLGAPLARMEGQIALTTLFHRFPGLRLAQPAESLPWRRLLPLRGLEALPVAF